MRTPGCVETSLRERGASRSPDPRIQNIRTEQHHRALRVPLRTNPLCVKGWCWSRS